MELTLFEQLVKDSVQARVFTGRVYHLIPRDKWNAMHSMTARCGFLSHWRWIEADSTHEFPVCKRCIKKLEDIANAHEFIHGIQSKRS